MQERRSRNLCIVWLLSLYFCHSLAAMNLKLVHVLSTNPYYAPVYNYTTSTVEIPSNLTYDYFTTESGDIPTSVKRSLFDLGVYLRKTYDHLLGKYYTSEVMSLRTTQCSVSNMAGQTISAGLWPPVEDQSWNSNLSWQPVNFEYVEMSRDSELLGTLNKSYQADLLRDIIKYNTQGPVSVYKPLYEHIRNESKLDVYSSIHVALLYLALKEMLEYDATLPKWSEGIFPDGEMLNVTLESYKFLSETSLRRRLNGGTLLEKIIADSQNHASGNLTKERKIFLYSGDDRNYAGIVNNLNLPLNHVPDAGAALIFEIYAEDDKSFLKLNYYTGRSGDTHWLKLPKCDVYCPLETFKELLKENLKPKPTESNSMATTTMISLSNISLLVAFVFYVSIK